jgi:hypothetical protein
LAIVYIKEDAVWWATFGRGGKRHSSSLKTKDKNEVRSLWAKTNVAWDKPRAQKKRMADLTEKGASKQLLLPVPIAW